MESSRTKNRIETQCCIAGGGPAGMMAGFLLARAGVDVTVLEKHADFLRDCRGDTVHPSTLLILRELGLLDDFLKRPHTKVTELRGIVGGKTLRIADFTGLKNAPPYLVLMPQWDFLDFLKDKAAGFPGFHLHMQARVTGLQREGERVIGAFAEMKQDRVQINAPLVIGADGRGSTVRGAARLAVKDLGAPIDVLWMRLSKQPSDPQQVLGVFNLGRIMVMIDRGDYWQCAFVIKKGGIDDARAKGLDALKTAIAEISPLPPDRLDELKSWDDIKLLTVAVDHLKRWWKPRLLCIGDCAHAMSPVGGVGINLAIQDAVAAANILAAPLKTGRVGIADLMAVQKRRALPAYGIQALQTLIHRRVMGPALANPKAATRVPWPLRLLDGCAPLRGLPARLVGMGLRPEHVRSGQA
jgi:2-polyprenyl-6-methoxyphenol hydroxylase-like FAD-dependent oxidoreductase